MEYIFPVIVLGVLVVAVYLRARMSRSRESDFEAIERFAESRDLRVVDMSRNDNHWRYWLRGKFTLSNLARVFVLVAEDRNGVRREIHLAFDPLNKSEDPKVLQEK
jgi:hypothetical protein